MKRKARGRGIEIKEREQNFFGKEMTVERS
jgi:hypothetical protein